jgi:hypothetical protein
LTLGLGDPTSEPIGQPRLNTPVKESLPTVFTWNAQRDRPALRGSGGASAANDSKRGEGGHSHSAI